MSLFGLDVLLYSFVMRCYWWLLALTLPPCLLYEPGFTLGTLIANMYISCRMISSGASNYLLRNAHQRSSKVKITLVLKACLVKIVILKWLPSHTLRSAYLRHLKAVPYLLLWNYDSGIIGRHDAFQDSVRSRPSAWPYFALSSEIARKAMREPRTLLCAPQLVQHLGWYND
ncbi:hypothetical protein BDV93DRAFT_36953 [Ceratobasidium sp. AG-I]|nr:hypothetical protein BDV93DRAFT_36953 [Ceratobasidium sp. AG-I]